MRIHSQNDPSVIYMVTGWFDEKEKGHIARSLVCAGIRGAELWRSRTVTALSSLNHYYYYYLCMDSSTNFHPKRNAGLEWSATNNTNNM